MKLLNPRTREFFGYFARHYPGRTTLMVALLGFGGLLEGVSVVTLVPLLQVASGQSGGATSGIEAVVEHVFVSVGLQPTVPVLMGVIVVGITLKAIVLWLAMRQVGFTEASVTLDLRLELVRSLLRARWGYFGAQSVGGFGNTISSEAIRSASAYREACLVLAGLIQAAVYLGVAALIAWQVSIAAIVTGGLLVWALRRFMSMGRSAGEEQTRLTKSLAARLVEALQGIKPMKAMAREEFFWPLLQEEAEGLNQAHRRTIVANQAVSLFQEPAVTLVLGVGLVGLLTVSHRSFSAILALAFVFYRLMANVKTIQVHYQSMITNESAFWSLRGQIDEAREAEETHPGSKPIDGLREAIELRSVEFAYGDLKVLEDFHARLEAGSITALLGPSGSGKTTILELICGLRRPDGGEIYIDGVALEDLDLEAWRRLIGYVPQEVFLFHDTVRRNLTLGDESIPDARVVAALEDAGAWDFISRNAEGIDAVIAPQASNLSGGQRQRLAIARALVKDPALLVLDEATTGLDRATEAGIMSTLSQLRGRVTILGVSHQPAFRDIADQTLELEDGEIRRSVGPEVEATRPGAG